MPHRPSGTAAAGWNQRPVADRPYNAIRLNNTVIMALRERLAAFTMAVTPVEMMEVRCCSHWLK
jgi:hypothetical protein